MKRQRIAAFLICTVLMFTGIIGSMIVTSAGTEELSIFNLENKKEPSYSDLKAFTAVTLEEEELTQDIFAGKDITILYTWATYCGYCIDEMPELQELKEKLPDNVQMLSFCADGLFYQDLAKQILEKTGFDVVTIINGEEDFAKLSAQIMYTPTTLFYDQSGKLLGEPIIGAPKNLEETYMAQLEPLLKTIEAEKEKETKADEQKD